MNSDKTVEEIFEVVNQLDEENKKALLRFGRYVILIDEVKRETAEAESE